MEKQTEKRVNALNSINLSNKANELKHIESIFPKNLLNDLITYKMKWIIQLQDIIKLNELELISKPGVTCIKYASMNKYALPVVFLRDTYERTSLLTLSSLALKEAHNEWSKVTIELKGIDRGVKPTEKISFLNSVGLLLVSREKSFNDFKADYFQQKI